MRAGDYKNELKFKKSFQKNLIRNKFKKKKSVWLENLLNGCNLYYKLLRWVSFKNFIRIDESHLKAWLWNKEIMLLNTQHWFWAKVLLKIMLWSTL